MGRQERGGEERRSGSRVLKGSGRVKTPPHHPTPCRLCAEMESFELISTTFTTRRPISHRNGVI
eukprot:26452-Hanusia_phi.AAC.1